MPRRKGFVKSDTHAHERPLPTLDENAINAVEAYVLDRFEGKCRPATAAPLLVLIVELHQAGIPFPTRRRVAEHIGAQGPFGVDSALKVYVERKLLSMSVEVLKDRTDPANMHLVARRHYTPSKTLINLVRDAKLGLVGNTRRRTSIAA
jgi:hypothetical protein